VPASGHGRSNAVACGAASRPRSPTPHAGSAALGWEGRSGATRSRQVYQQERHGCRPRSSQRTGIVRGSVAVPSGGAVRPPWRLEPDDAQQHLGGKGSEPVGPEQAGKGSRSSRATASSLRQARWSGPRRGALSRWCGGCWCQGRAAQEAGTVLGRRSRTTLVTGGLRPRTVAERYPSWQLLPPSWATPLAA
jgi:hypothetical protein